VIAKHHCWLDWITLSGVLFVGKVLVVKGGQYVEESSDYWDWYSLAGRCARRDRGCLGRRGTAPATRYTRSSERQYSYVLARLTQKVKVFRALTLLGVCHKWCDGRKGSTEACLKSTATNYVENFLRKIEWKVSL